MKKICVITAAVFALALVGTNVNAQDIGVTVKNPDGTTRDARPGDFDVRTTNTGKRPNATSTGVRAEIKVLRAESRDIAST